MRTYHKPETEIVLINAPAVMQNIIEASGEDGPHVNPDDPVTPGPGGELSNGNGLWDEWDTNR